MPDNESTSFVEVDTTAGPVRGRWAGGSARFLGIPFAEPPIGELRFAAPVPHRRWEGVRDALEFGATPQRASLQEVTLIPEPSIPGDSTLSVNVFTPVPGDTEARLPVLVYIHGGGFVSGSPASPWYNGAAFNRDGIIVVTVSYRLGFDGFGWIADAPQNRGVRDWILALEWVRANIAGFGGDPDRVTVSGQSAGGAAVLVLLATERAQPLFAQAYSISGPISNVPIEQAEAFGRALAAELGVAPTRAGYSTLSEDEILDAQQRMTAIGAPGAAGEEPADPLGPLIGLVSEGLPLAPVVDGELLTQPVLDAFRAGIGAGKPLMIGATDDEFSMLLIGAGEALEAIPPIAVLDRLGLEPDQAADYLAHNEPGRRIVDVVGRYVTDVMFRSAARSTAQAREKSPTWLYRFSWRSPVFGYAVHCLDMPFIFDALEMEKVDVIAGPRPPQSLADDVHGDVVAFVRDGDPGWPHYEAADEATRVYDTPSVVIDQGYAAVRALDAIAVGERPSTSRGVPG